MDNGHISDNFRMDDSIVSQHGEKEAARNADDILVRRLKNRERQRRYRARKRHEADLKKASMANQSAQLHYQQMPTNFLSVPVEVDTSVNVTTPDCFTSVHCRRDWKKDARRAHLHKKQEVSPVIPDSGTTTPCGSSVAFPESGIKEDLQSSHSNTLILENNATHKLQPCHRRWKAEARNKKGSD